MSQKIVSILPTQLTRKHRLDKPHLERLTFSELRSVGRALSEANRPKGAKPHGKVPTCSCCTTAG